MRLNGDCMNTIQPLLTLVWRLRSQRVKIEEDTLLPDTFLSALSKPKGCKCQASLVDDSGDQDASADDDEEGGGDTTSEENGTGDEGEEESDESEEEILPKVSRHSLSCFAY